MLRSWRTLAALLLAVPLNAQVARVSAPTWVHSVVVPLAVSAAPIISAPALSAPAPAGSLVSSLPISAPVATPAAAGEGPSAVPLLPAAAPLAAAAGDPRRANLPIERAVAEGSNIAFGRGLFDGQSDLTTRSGSVFSPSRTPQPTVLGDVAFVRVKASPAAPIKSVPDTLGLYGPTLLNRVSQIAAEGQTPHDYREASKYLFSTADNHTLDGVSGVADAYSGVFVPGTSSDENDYSETGDPTHDGWSRSQSMNVEHVFPQSLFERGLPMRADLHHLMATFSHPNSMRGSLPFGVAKGALDYKNDAGARRDGLVFEPPDFTKGRVARAMLYFYARYKDKPFFETRRVAAFWNQQVDILLDWNRRFPPTIEEQRRNDQVQAFQGNRNPFVDDSGLADRIGADALRSGLPAPARFRVIASPTADERRSDKPRKGKKRSAGGLYTSRR